jgi:hypothetical protein
VPISGAIAAHAGYVKRGEVCDDELLEHQIEEDVDDWKVAIREVMRSVNAGWQTVSIWSMENIEGKRRYCKYCVATKNAQVAKVRLIYDHNGSPE